MSKKSSVSFAAGAEQCADERRKGNTLQSSKTATLGAKDSSDAVEDVERRRAELELAVPDAEQGAQKLGHAAKFYKAMDLARSDPMEGFSATEEYLDVTKMALSSTMEARSKVILDTQKKNDDGFRAIETGVEQLLHGMRAEVALRRLDEQKLQTKLQALDDKSSEALRKERWERYNSKVTLERAVLEKTAEGHGVLEEEKQLRKKAAEATEELCQEICKMYTNIEEARKYRIESCEKLARGVQEKLDEVRDATAAENKIREESQQTLLEMFGQMGEKLQRGIEEARKERLNYTEKFLGVMERTLPKIDNASQVLAYLAETDIEQSRGTAKGMASAAEANMKRRSTKIASDSKTLNFRTRAF